MQNQITGLAALHNMAPDGSVSGISGTVIRVEKYSTGTNRFGPYSFQKIELRDSQNGTAKVKLKNHPEMGADWTNAAVTISGNIGVDVYEGTPGRSSRAWLVDDKCQIVPGLTPVNAGGGGNYQQAPAQGQQPGRMGPPPGAQGQQQPQRMAPPQGQQSQHHQQQPRQQQHREEYHQQDEPPPREPTEHHRQPEAPKVWRPHGQTVGMALNNARSILLELYKPDGEGGDPNYFTSPEFCRDLWEIGSDFIRVAKKLEAGELAPGAVARAKAEAAAAQQQRQTDRQQPAPQQQREEGSNDPPGKDWTKEPDAKW